MLPKAYRAWKEWKKQRLAWKKKITYCNQLAESTGDKLRKFRAFNLWKLRFSKRKAELEVLSKPNLILIGENALLGIDQMLEQKADNELAIQELSHQNGILGDNFRSARKLALDLILEH